MWTTVSLTVRVGGTYLSAISSGTTNSFCGSAYGSYAGASTILVQCGYQMRGALVTLEVGVDPENKCTGRHSCT